VSPDGSVVATVAEPVGELSMIVWDVAAGRPRWTVSDGMVTAVAFARDGSVLAAAGRHPKDRIRLWHPQTGRAEGDFEVGWDPVRSLAFCRDGRLVAGLGGRAEAWDPRTGRRLGERLMVPHGVDRVAVAPDDRQAVMSTPDIYIGNLGAARVGDEPDIPVKKTLTGLALSPDGRLLATADGTGIVRLWEMLTRAEAAALPFVEPATGVAFSPDGRTLAVTTGGGTVLYGLPGSAARLTLPPGATPDTLVAFATDGRRLVTAGNRDATATVWDVADVVRRPAAGAVKPMDLVGCWAALADSDPKAGYAAVWKFVADPDRAVPLLATELGRPLPPTARIARLIADLDHPRYPAREQATRDLEAVGEQAVEALREARKGKVSAEQAERIDGLLGKLAGPRPSPDRLRASRAVAALELIASVKARVVIEEVSKGPSGAPRTQEAKAALGRWK
jgi:hypothetical protein